MHKEFIDKYLEETNDIIRNIDREEINKFVNILFDVWRNGKKVITMGNGGSASNASHFSSDLSKTIINSSAEKDIVKNKKQLREAMSKLGLKEAPFGFDMEGCKIIYEGR